MNRKTKAYKSMAASGQHGALLRERVKEKRRSIYLHAVNEAAERIFAAKGVDDSRMPEIAAEAGISLGTLYGVIDGKESLYAGIHRIRIREFLDCICEASETIEGTLERHLAVLRSGSRYFLEHADFLRMHCREGNGWAVSLPTYGAGEVPWREGTAILQELFVRGMEEQVYVEDDPELLVRKMLALQQVELIHWVMRGMSTPHETVLERLEAQFLRAFCTLELQRVRVGQPA